MSDTEDEDNLKKCVKITLVGESLTGKSSVCNRYLGGSGNAWGTTQGAEVAAAQWAGTRPPTSLQLCDVAGAAMSTEMLPNYLYASDVVIFVYDLTNLQSFEKLNIWMQSITDIFKSEPKKPLMALFGNKSDLEHQRAVRLSCVKGFSAKHLLENFIGSARTGEMVNVTFSKLISRVLGVEMPSEVPAYRKPTEMPASEQTNANPPIQLSETSNNLIMDRKVLRKIQRKASSSVCSLQ